jgi:Tc toxin complex TcA C-terminal TcB-binding domain
MASVGQIDPLALLELRATGSCDFSIPEVWFDLYYPGQYKRRIKSIRVSVPCVVGPYTNVSAKLILIRSQIRPEPQLSTPLIRDTPSTQHLSSDEHGQQRCGRLRA